ncbi:hypothetical protein [Streptomyces genisteinicus]|uniref:Uncharacterized protein n=1 Tax=Streptomyces genisteinicus TaxID=2768068 RepID=A0A7H0I2V7_9ACTN|nr:hypothetical protein [Streptomyces genisteinicus]QNP67123.1 hypothetical protein IAG43_32335 [Streptomyces genisteinicus]
MGSITVGSGHLDRLLADSTSAHAMPYQRAFAELADSHRGRSADEIVPLLRRAAERSALAFTDTDLVEQAEAISAGRRYVLRVTVT